LAKELDEEISKLALAISDMEPQPHAPAPAAQGDQDVKAMAERAARMKANNGRVISLLNSLRAAQGRPPMAASAQAGVVTKEVRDELNRAVPTGYTTWRELFSKLQGKVDEAVSAAPAEPGSVQRAQGDQAPASVPDLKVNVPQSQPLPSRTPVAPGQ
jgi:hypothetical protein